MAETDGGELSEAQIIDAFRLARGRRTVTLTEAARILSETPNDEKRQPDGGAVALLLKHLLDQQDMQALLKAELERLAMMRARETLKDHPTVVNKEYWGRLYDAESELGQKIAGLAHKNRDTMGLIKRLYKVLQELGYDDKYVLPELRPPFPEHREPGG